MESRQSTSAGAVVLRDVIEADLPILFEQQLDPVANELAAFAARDRDAFMEHWQRNIVADEDVTKRTILFEGRVAGHVVCFERFGEREIGYWLGREFWGRGIATQALSEFLRHVTERPLIARVAKRNGASLRVLQKCGFTVSREELSCVSPTHEDVVEVILYLEADAARASPC
jgi:RimJ/RimL family protein N-acetyltransferase